MNSPTDTLDSRSSVPHAAGAGGTRQRRALTTLLAAVLAAPALLALPPAFAITAAEHGAAGPLEEIVVTARKRAEPLLDVPTAVTVLRADALDAMGATRLQDAELRLPNVATNQSPLTGFTARYIRGMNAAARNIGFESGYGVFVDGVYSGRYAASNRILQDVERIEFLPGPQGTLFGKNTTLGVLNVVTRVPDTAPAADLTLDLGNNGQRGARLGASSGVGEHWVAWGALGSRERDGFDRNRFSGRRGNNIDHHDALLGLDGTIGDTRVRLTADYYRSTPDLIARQRLEGLGALPKRIASHDQDGTLEDRDYGIALRLEHDVRWGTVTSISAWRDFETTADLDDDVWEIPVQHLVDWHEAQRQFSQELRLAGDHRRFTYLAGAYYQTQDADLERSVASLFGQARVTGSVDTDTQALFGNLGYDVTDRLTAEAGLRWTRETKKMPDYAQSGGGILIDFETRDRRSVTSLTPSASLHYALNDNAAAYLRYARSFKSGGFNVDLVTMPEITPLEFDDENADTFEIGVKATWLDGRLQLNAAVFHTDYDDLQVSQYAVVPGAALPTLLVTNAASANTRGAELGLELTLANWQLGTQLGYTRGRVESFPDPLGPGSGDYRGNGLGGPDWTTASFVQYRHALSGIGDLTLTAEHLYQGAVGGDLSDDPLAISDSLSLVNLTAQLVFGERRQWRTRLWVDNVFDTDRVVERRPAAASGLMMLLGYPPEIADSTVGLYNTPRTYGLELRLSL